MIVLLRCQRAPLHPSGYNFGHNIFDNIELEIGGQLIDKHYGHWMEAHIKLTEKTVAAWIDSGNRNDHV